MENNRDKYLWKPNDNSSKTLTRYSLEGEHWINSIKNATSKPTTSVGDVFSFLSLLLSFTINVITFILMILVELVKWIIKVWPRKEKVEIPTFDNRPDLSNEEANELIKKANESGVIEEIDFE